MGQHKKSSSEASDVPPYDEFKTMRRIHTHLMKWKGRQIEWNEGDRVFIRSPKKAKHADEPIPDLEIWRAKISELRTSSQPVDETDGTVTKTASDNVWALVTWYYSPTMFEKALGHNLILDQISTQDELILMHDHTQVLSVLTFEDHATVFRYEEDNIKQSYIPLESIFSRVSWRMSKGSCVNGRPTECGCKTCKRTYRPQESVWHYCANPSCRQWFDSKCLEARSCRMSREKLAEFYQESFEPDHERLVPELNVAPKMVRPKQPRTGSSYDFIPDDLLALARRPITKGMEYGVVGMALPILRARVLVDAAQKGRCLSQSWVMVVWEDAGPRRLPPYVPQTTRTGNAVCSICPLCASPI